MDNRLLEPMKMLTTYENRKVTVSVASLFLLPIDEFIV